MNTDYINNIDFKYIKNILDINYGKKVFCFGAGTAAEILMDLFGENLKVNKFLDNNASLWGDSIKGVEIDNPEKLLEEKDKFVVLILSRHVYEISLQLNNYGLKKEQDYYDIYTSFLPYFMVKKHMALIDEFQKFIERISDGELKNRPILYDERIGIVYICNMYANYTSYCMAQVLLLRYYGYRVSLIIDTMPAFESYCLFEGVEDIIRKKIDTIIPIIKNKSNDIEIFYIEQEGKTALDADYLKAIDLDKKAVLQQYDKLREYGFLDGDKNREKIAEDILKNTLMYIKSFIDKHEFDAIHLAGGKGGHRGNYTYYAKKIGMRVSTHDVPGPGKMMYSTDGIAGHQEDVVKIINGEYFNIHEKKKLISLAKDNFEKKRNSTIDSKECNYQITGYKKMITPYDIVIPLNIFWDAAALYRDRIFDDYLDWLKQTLEFIMNKTTATVLLREHPVQTLLQQYKYIDLNTDLPEISKYKDRIFYAKASEKMNTYQYIEQCKLVLPYTSTVGLEAVLIGKNIITHTDVYYSDIDIAINAKNKTDYFNNILYYLEHTKLSTNINKDNAYLAYFYIINNVFECEYCIHNTSWMKISLKELSEVKGVSWTVKCVGEGIPVIYSAIKDKMAVIDK